MKLATMISHSSGMDVLAAAAEVATLERVGLDQVWVPEGYSFDAISLVGYLAALTERVEIGTSIVNVFSRTPALMAMTAAGCDVVSRGRFMLGLGASGPQVVEGFHGMAYDKPMQRVKEYIESCRMVWRREPLVFDGETVRAPLPPGQGTGLGKPIKLINRPRRDRIPIWWASLKPLSVQATAAIADGWLPILFVPEKHQSVWGARLQAGLAQRDPELGPLEIAAGGVLAVDEALVGEERRKVLDRVRPTMALYVGGMGARGKNFYNDICRAYGYEREAEAIQDLYLDGKAREAAALVPDEWIELSNLVGPPGYVKERVAAYREAGVTVLSVDVVGDDKRAQIEQLRTLVDA